MRKPESHTCNSIHRYPHGFHTGPGARASEGRRRGAWRSARATSRSSVRASRSSRYFTTRRASTRSTRSSGRPATRSSRTSRRAATPSSSATSSSPSSWSQNATNIVAQKYFRGTLGTPQRESSVRQLVGRVVDTITGWGTRNGYFATEHDAQVFAEELAHLLVNQKAAFNSPGVVQRRGPRHAAAVLRVLHPRRRRPHVLDPQLVRRGGDDLQGRLGLRDQPVAHPFLEGVARRRRDGERARARSCAAPTPRPARSSPAARPGARRRW